MAILIVTRPDPVEWLRIRAKWAVVRVANGYGITFMGQPFGSGKPFKLRRDAEKQADANARSEMHDVLRGFPENTLADFGIEASNGD